MGESIFLKTRLILAIRGSFY